MGSVSPGAHGVSYTGNDVSRGLSDVELMVLCVPFSRPGSRNGTNRQRLDMIGDGARGWLDSGEGLGDSTMYKDNATHLNWKSKTWRRTRMGWDYLPYCIFLNF